MDDLGRQVLKEWYWLFIFAALVAVAFAPSFLKGKCPRCSKRKLVSFELDNHVRKSIEAEHANRQFLTFYTCHSCGAHLFRERTGPFEDALAAGLEKAFERSTVDDAALVP
jgi:hypothetical protein